MRDYDPAPTGRQLAVQLGPERLAFVLSVMVVIAAALLFGSRLGTPASRPGSSPPAPTPRASAAVPALRSSTSLVRTASGSLVVSVPRGPAGAEP